MGRHERFDPVARRRARRAYNGLVSDLGIARRPRRWRIPFGWSAAVAAAAVFVGVLAAPEGAMPELHFAADEAAAAETVTRSTGRFDLCGGGPRIDCVVDGDTFWIGGEKVRIADIDTPEIHPARCADEERRGQAAKRRLLELLNGGEVTLASAGSRDRDRYGRLLRLAIVDGRNVGDNLVEEGLARPYGGGRRPWC